MVTFTDAEVEYLNSQPLGRLATVGPDGRLHVTPVGVFYDPETRTIVVGGHAGSDMAASKKFRDARRRPDAAFVADDLASVDPWTPRFVETGGGPGPLQRLDVFRRYRAALGARCEEPPAMTELHGVGSYRFP